MSSLDACKDKITEITDLLYNESVMLSEGRIEGLKEIVQQKTAAMTSLQSLLSQLDNSDDTGAIIPHVNKLQKLADENGIILKRVTTGVRSARERLRAIQYNNAKVGAYNKVGARLYLSEDQINSEKLV